MMKAVKVTVYKCRCEVCGHESTRFVKPVKCSNQRCGSPNWNKPKSEWRKPGRPPLPGSKRKSRAGKRLVSRLNETAQPASRTTARTVAAPADALSFLDQQ